MPSLRDEIAAMLEPEPDNRDDLLRNAILRDVLARVDKHEANTKESFDGFLRRTISGNYTLEVMSALDAWWALTPEQREPIRREHEKIWKTQPPSGHERKPGPSHERIARGNLKNALQVSLETSDYPECVSIFKALAIVEAIDTNTEVMREWVDLLRKQSRIVENLVAAAKPGDAP